MDHLYGLGHRADRRHHRTAGQPAQPDRLRGTTVARARPEADGTFIVTHGDFSIESGCGGGRASCSLGAEPPTAIFCFNDEMAIGVIDTARRRGVPIPRQLSVVGFDDIRFARHVNPR